MSDAHCEGYQKGKLVKKSFHRQKHCLYL